MELFITVVIPFATLLVGFALSQLVEKRNRRAEKRRDSLIYQREAYASFLRNTSNLEINYLLESTKLRDQTGEKGASSKTIENLLHLERAYLTRFISELDIFAFELMERSVAEELNLVLNLVYEDLNQLRQRQKKIIDETLVPEDENDSKLRNCIYSWKLTPKSAATDIALSDVHFAAKKAFVEEVIM